MKKAIGLFSLASVLLFGTAGGVNAENTKGRWDIGGSLFFWSTLDDIRSNAAFVLFDQPGPDGIPNTGDETILFADPRPDDILSRETTLQEGLSFNVNFAYGITDWLSLQIDASYYNADVVQFDTFVTQRQFQDFNSDGIYTANEVEVFRQSQPFPAGTITQIPLSASLVFRFRRDSPLNPYVGVGAGYVLVDSTVDPRLSQINDTLSTQKISTVGVNDFSSFLVCQGNTCPPFQGFQVDVEDSFQWLLMGGAEYFFNSKVSIMFDARYTVSDAAVNIKSPAFPNQDQLVFNYTAVNDTLQFCGDPALDDFFSDPSLVNFNRRDNGIPPSSDPAGFQGCRPGLLPEPGQTGRLEDQILIQGGKVDLTNFQVGVGVRFYF